MSYALLSDDLLLQLEAAEVSRDARLLYVEGLVYCATALTDGLIRVRLARFSDADDVEACALELIDAGLWARNGSHYLVVDYLDHQQKAEDVERKRAEARRRQERSRRHKRGDHSMCTKGRYCPHGADSDPSHVSHAHVTRDVRTPILPDPSQREGQGKDKDGATALAPKGAHASAPDTPSPMHDAVVSRLTEEATAFDDVLTVNTTWTPDGQCHTAMTLEMPGVLVSDGLRFRYVIPCEVTYELRAAIEGWPLLAGLRVDNSQQVSVDLNGLEPQEAATRIFTVDSAVYEVLSGETDWRQECEWTTAEESA